MLWFEKVDNGLKLLFRLTPNILYHARTFSVLLNSGSRFVGRTFGVIPGQMFTLKVELERSMVTHQTFGQRLKFDFCTIFQIKKVFIKRVTLSWLQNTSQLIERYEIV